MISFDEAISIARQHKGNINTCTEYERGYVFGSTEDDAFIDADPGKQIGDVMPI